MPYHKLLDGAQERLRGKKGVGTTGRGIGPCYTDKVSREGIRVGDLLDEEYLKERLDLVLEAKRAQAKAFGIDLGIDEAKLLADLLAHGKRWAGCVTDSSVLVTKAIKDGKKVMFEGAQGTMLDIDNGTYPFVTSSTCTSAGICHGVGVGPAAIGQVIGVTKAYTTRVGAGPFVTELSDDIGTSLLEKGGEFGTTTGRARRCGRLDMVVVRHAVRLNGMTSMAVTKLDVLNGLDKVKVCVAYRIDGKRVENFPSSVRQLERAEPIYEELAGWDEWEGSTAEMCRRGLSAFPKAMRDYLDYISKDAECPADIISVGKRRDETIDLRQDKW